jgi:hypothetical protein
MGFLTGSMTFSRFRVAGPKPRLFDADHLDRLREHATHRGPATAEGVEATWGATKHVFDGDFTQEKNVYADHLLFDLRAQTDKPPADRLKAYYETELAALAKDNPSGRPSARQKREAKEIARGRVAQEAKDGRYRKWKLTPCAWDAGTNALFFGGSLTPQAAGRLELLWVQTFGAGPDRPALAGDIDAVTAATLAVALDPRAENEVLSEFVPGLAADGRPYWCPQEGVPTFLGNEFLLWLWFVADTETDTVRTPDGGEVTFMFSGGIKMDDPRGTLGDITANSASAVRMPEARAAARGGKLPREAALTVARAGDVFSFKLKPETLTVTAARVPPPDDAASQRDRELARLQHLRDLAEILDQLFAAFVLRRMAAGWGAEVQAVAAWLRSGRGAAERAV